MRYPYNIYVCLLLATCYLFTYVIVSCTSVYVVPRMHNLLDITSMNHNVVHESNTCALSPIKPSKKILQGIVISVLVFGKYLFRK